MVAYRTGSYLPSISEAASGVLATAIGHSEGGIVAVLAGGGPNQLFDLVAAASKPKGTDEPASAAEARVQKLLEGWARVEADPDSADKLWLGHPHRRWSSFLKTSTLEGLLAGRAAVFLAQGTADAAVSSAGFDVCRAELAARGRDVVALRLEGADHGFRKADDPPASTAGFQDVFAKATEWFLTKSEARKTLVAKELADMQGDWQVVSVTVDGNQQALAGAMATMRVDIAGDVRTLKTAKTILSQGTFRIDPSARPRQFDMTVTSGNAKGQTLRGIYEVDGDTQRLCLAMRGGPRPTEFASRPDTGHTFMVMKRMTP